MAIYKTYHYIVYQARPSLTLTFLEDERWSDSRVHRVRACNSINLKPGGIIELLLKIVNVLRMRPGFGVAATESTRTVLLSHLVKSAKRFCALKDVKDLFASGIQAWKWKCPQLYSCT